MAIHNRVAPAIAFGVSLVGLSLRSIAQSSESQLGLFAGQARLTRLAPDTLSATEAISLDGCGLVTVNITATRSDLTVYLVAPGSELINPETVTGLGGTFASVDGADTDSFVILPIDQPGHHYIYQFPALDTGVYSLHLEAPPALADEVAIFTEVVTDSPLRVALLTTDSIVPQSSSVAISAAVFEGVSPLPGASVVVSVRAMEFSDPETIVTLADSGGSGDAETGDGLYSAVFTPSRMGVHSVVAEITGTRADSTPFTRQAATQFRVVSTGASFVGNLTDHGVDTNSNGWFEFIQFDQPVAVSAGGWYGLSVYARTGGGETLYAEKHTNLPTGSHNLSAQIRAADLLATAENGPYLVDRVELTQSDPDLGYVMIARQICDPPYQTAAYQWTQFERPAIQFLGMESDSGVDSDSDGKFDVLRVVLNVTVRTPGLFKIGGQIADGCNRRIAWGDAQQTLTPNQPQQIVLDFPGSDIGKHGVAGPFKVRSLTLARLGSSPPESLIVNTVGQTGYYQASAFEGVSNGNVDCNANGQPDDCECLGDMNGDHQVSIVDLAVFLSSFGLCTGQSGFNAAADYDGNGCVSLSDYTCFLGRFGGNCW